VALSPRTLPTATPWRPYEETQVLNQDHDEAVRNEADGAVLDDPVGRISVPAPRAPSAVRLLEMAARDTDQWRSDAKAEAAEIVAVAQREASAMVRSAQRAADTMVEAAKAEATRTVDDARATADEVLTVLSQRRAREEAELARLQQLAQDHAHHLRQHATDILDRLDADPAQPRH
jgi:vacuolar-type H+-ATPase subunit H